MHLVFYTLGGFTIYRDGDLLYRGMWDTTKAFTLCKVLLTYYDHPLAIDQVIHWLWPDLPRRQATAKLQAALVEINAVLQSHPQPNPSASLVRVDRDTLQWRIERCWFDARVLLEAAYAEWPSHMALDRLEQAANLYRGPYLVEDYDAEWSKARRAELALAYEKVILNMADAHALLGDYREALRVCRRVFAANPTNTEAVSRLLDFAYYAAETGQGLHAYSLHCAALAGRLRHEPDPRLIYKVNRLRRGLPPQETSYPGELRAR